MLWHEAVTARQGQRLVFCLSALSVSLSFLLLSAFCLFLSLCLFVLFFCFFCLLSFFPISSVVFILLESAARERERERERARLSKLNTKPSELFIPGQSNFTPAGAPRRGGG